MRVTRPFSAKHLDAAGEQLTSLAGSLGYVTSDVLNQKGNGKPVDLWSIGYDTPLQIIHAQMEYWLLFSESLLTCSSVDTPLFSQMT
jgi:hypothetical protein